MKPRSIPKLTARERLRQLLHRASLAGVSTALVASVVAPIKWPDSMGE